MSCSLYMAVKHIRGFKLYSRSVQDGEGQVDEACAEALAALLAAAQRSEETHWTDDTKGNPVLHMILDMLSDASKISQAAACVALDKVPYPRP